MKKMIALTTLILSFTILASNASSTTRTKKIEKDLEKEIDQALKSNEELTHFQTGVASFYGAKWNGRRTANGEIFNTYELTAAHKTLAFGTKVKVTNLENGQSVVVRINDRGPFIKGRVIDLSTAAFSKIATVNKGITKVKLEIIK